MQATFFLGLFSSSAFPLTLSGAEAAGKREGWWRRVGERRCERPGEQGERRAVTAGLSEGALAWEEGSSVQDPPGQVFCGGEGLASAEVRGGVGGGGWRRQSWGLLRGGYHRGGGGPQRGCSAWPARRRWAPARMATETSPSFPPPPRPGSEASRGEAAVDVEAVGWGVGVF